jgi:PAS domain S-box-containing protein
VAIRAIIPADRGSVSTAIRRVLEYESGGYYDIKYTVVSGVTGQERIVRAKGRAYFNEEKIAYRFNGTLQDITEQEIASLKLMQAEQTARLAIESADLGTYSLNLQTGEFITSPRYNAIFGSSVAVGRQTVVAMIHPDDVPIRDKANEESLKTGVIDYSIRFYWPDGTLHWMKVNGRVLFDEQGKPHKRVGVVQDITEQKEFAELLTQQVYERTLELQRSNKDLSAICARDHA